MKIPVLKYQKDMFSASFKGYSTEKDSKGDYVYSFNYPTNSNKNEVFLKVFSVKCDKNGKYDVDKELVNSNTGSTSLKLSKFGTKVNLEKAYGIGSKTPFAYCYEIVSNNGATSKRAVDTGELINYWHKDNHFDKFNLVFQNGTRTNKGGAMLLLIPDTYRPGFVIEDSSKCDSDLVSFNEEILNRAENSSRNYSNKVGGTLGGILHEINNVSNVGYTRIVSLPLFTDDSISSHGYWIKNAMQIVQSQGNLNDYAALQRAMFKHGINLVADGALVNEGLEGIHFKDVLKYGEKSPFYGWFRAGNLKNSPLSMGVFSKNHEFIRLRVVNNPFCYRQNANGKIEKSKNPNYDAHKPTYMQIYDKRLAGRDQLEDTSKLLKFYEKTNTNNLFEINTHNDTVVNYSFEIEPKLFEKNIDNLSEYNKRHDKKIKLNSSSAALFLTRGENYKLDDKFESGVETWDANTDIAKLNYAMSNADSIAFNNLSGKTRDSEIENLKRNNCSVQDYAVASGKYWTQLTKNILTEYSAKNIGKISNNPDEAVTKIDELIDNGDLPKNLIGKIDKRTVKNILNDNYNLSINSKSSDYAQNLLEGIMELPLESIEFGDDIVSALAYPYISNRAYTPENIGKSRYDLYKSGNKEIPCEYKEVYDKTTKMYTDKLNDFAKGILANVNKNIDNKIFEGDKVTDLGKYVLPVFGQDITKFAIVKALYPDLKYSIKPDTGEIVYDYKTMKSLSLGQLGINARSPEDVSSQLVSKINSGISNIPEKDIINLRKSLSLRLSNVNANSYKLAEVLIDKSSAGLDWRIDGTKDVADMDSIRNHHSKFADTWEDLSDFWSRFNKEVFNVNPNAYVAAEMTDAYDLHHNSNMSLNNNFSVSDKYSDGNVASDNFVRNSGMTTTANYSTFFNDLIKVFGKGFEDGSFEEDYTKREGKIFSKLMNENYVYNVQLKSLLYSYTFIGNHDKPRALHCLALDMTDFSTDYSKNASYEQKVRAIALLKNKSESDVSDSDVRNFDFTQVSGKAIAMGEALKLRMNDAISEISASDDEKAKLSKNLNIALSHLSNGQFKDAKFAPDAFGVKPFDQIISSVLDEMDYVNGSRFDIDLKRNLYNKSFEKVIVPAMSRLSGMMQFLVALPGNATLFAGDELGLTGYDERCKNIYLQSRNCLHWDWVNEKNKNFILNFQKEINNAMKLRAKSDLEPLNSGTPFVLRPQFTVDGKNNITGILRQSQNGAMVVSLLNPSGVDSNYKNSINAEDKILSRIDLSLDSEEKSIGGRAGLADGLTPGKIFHNADEKDKSEYVVSDDGMSICKKGDNGNIEINGRTMILYSNPEIKPSQKNNPSFSGHKILYNPQYNFISINSYVHNPIAKLGDKFLRLSK